MADRIANPIYDSVFKFLMEDNRVARAMLSALLKNLVEGRSDNSDEEIRYIYDRLAYAAANPDVRREMDIEDEIFGELENLDTTIAKQKQQLTQQEEQISQQEEQISQQEEQISQQEEQISQQKEQLSQKDEQLSLMQEELNRLRALLKQ